MTRFAYCCKYSLSPTVPVAGRHPCSTLCFRVRCVGTGRKADRDCERALDAFGGGLELPERRDGLACVMVAWGGRLFGVLVERGLRGGQFRERPQDRPHGFRQFGLGAHVAKYSMIARQDRLRQSGRIHTPVGGRPWTRKGVAAGCDLTRICDESRPAPRCCGPSCKYVQTVYGHKNECSVSTKVGQRRS